MKRYMPFIIIGFVLFVVWGDKVIPGELGQASTQTRAAVNNFLISLFPSWEPKTKPYQRTERAIEKIEPKR